MGLYDNITNRAAATALVPREEVEEIFKAAAYQSAVLACFRRVPIQTDSARVKVTNVLPTAYWVSPKDVGAKKTTTAGWTNKYIYIEEIAAIVPMPISVVEDVAAGRFSLNAETLPLLAEAFAVLIDETILFGTSAPATFPSPIVTAATAAGKTYSRGSNAVAKGGVAEDFSQLVGLVEDGGYNITDWLYSIRFNRHVRGARDTTGQKLAGITGMGPSALAGGTDRLMSPDVLPTAPGTTEIVGIEARQFLLGYRQEMRVQVFDQGVISDPDTGLVVQNLMQNDLMAIRATMRLGWQVANPINRSEAVEANRYPAGVLLSPA